MINDRTRTIQTYRNVEGGVDSGRAPNILNPNQIAFGVNLTVRGGYPTSRPGWQKNILATAFDEGLFQGSTVFHPPKGGAKIALMISGRVFLITIADYPASNGTIEEITISGDPNSDVLTQCWMVQAEDFLIIQDGESKAFIYDGVSSRRAVVDEVPIGKQMAYGNGRLWVANGREFVAGDIVGGSSGTSAYDYRDAVIKFTENTYIAEGGAFGVPMQSGNITGMAFIANLDTSLGEGELIVFTRKGVYTVNVPADRTLWKDLNIPLQRVALLGYGARSANSIVNSNSDLFFRSDDGIRSLIFARRNFSDWGNVPMSKEMNRLLLKDDRTLLNFCSGTVFDNRLLMTCSPALDTEHGTYHRGLVMLDYDLISGMWGKTAPAYDGVWTGLNILQIVKGDFGDIERCFFIVLNADGLVNLWEQTLTLYDDRPSDTDQTSIEWQVEYASGLFQDGGEELKKLQTGDIWIDQIRGTANLQIQYRPDQYPIWQDWHSWSICGDATVCDIEDCALPEFPLAQYRTRRRFPQPADDDETTDGKPMRYGYEFQPKLTITGACRIKKLRLHAERQPEFPDGDCPQDEVCSAITGCSDNPFTYNADP